MLENLKKIIFKGSRIHPLLVVLASGLYPLLYYYDKNYAIINSKPQFLFFVFCYIILPIVFYCIILFVCISFKSLHKFKGLVLPICNSISFFLLIVITLYGFDTIKIIIALFLGLVLGKLLATHINKLVVFQFILACLVLPKLMPDLYRELVYSKEWAIQPDDIDVVKFKQKPNVYVIQPDGYTNFSDLSNSIYNFDNSAFETFLANEGFTAYRDYRSNYSSTLSSNSSMFNMKHHYYGNKTLGINPSHNSRDEIVSSNPALRVFKNNGYKTFLMLQVPYLLANRPAIDFDYCNISIDEVSYISRGFSLQKDLLKDTKTAITTNKTTHNFFFIESMLPSHIVTHYDSSTTVEDERTLYLNRIKAANTWLKELVEFITKEDPNGLVIIAADHGGYVGLDFMKQNQTKQTDPLLVKSMFSSVLAIKWTNEKHEYFDKDLKTSVNLFRVLFSYLSDDKTYLKNQQEDKSYLIIRKGAPTGVYEFINENDETVFKDLEPKE
ncbi:hypothetical protein [Winogradskyella sp. UBA3174]|uniref:hypothetical protein n=1 Tax=Winogradskyella sp. UBA3174 TaxID=1947785 RepID=UPI002601281F|nr:hypothetical protein [Winogradskyella sp. UBA3174]|tara:strand:- start:44504 stop:45994 length:1491 start_codon:yes stop_codon:yes gene_type:complete